MYLNLSVEVEIGELCEHYFLAMAVFLQTEALLISLYIKTVACGTALGQHKSGERALDVTTKFMDEGIVNLIILAEKRRNTMFYFICRKYLVWIGPDI